MKDPLYFILLVLLPFSAQAQITSTFDTNADGWTFLNSTIALPATHSPTGGNPAGFISATYSSNISFSTQNWIAPAKFLGNQVVRSMDMNLRFDIQQSPAGTNSNINGDVRIESGGGMVIVYSLPEKPAVAPLWSSYSLKLDETQGWRINTTSGTLATRIQIIEALSSITSLEIRGTYATNASFTSSIDNVILEQRTLSPAPIITSFSPASADPGTSITISGNNFGSTIANNAVYFGSVAGTITSASPTQLIVTVPLGAQYGNLAVINKTTALTKPSDKPFTPTFTGGGRIIPASFDLPINLSAASDYGAADADDFLSAGDMDGDGWIDLISTDAGNTLLVYRNLGAGGDLTTSSFASKFTLTGAGNRVATKAIDLDGDGKLDIATGYYTDDFNTGFATYRNISTPGNLAFEPVEKWEGLAYSAILSTVVDVDGDGRADLIGRGTSGSVAVDFWIAQNISSPGNIEFGASRSYFGNAINGLNPVTSSDLDNDGKPEMIIVSGDIYIAKNNSTPGVISFDTPFEIDGVATIYGPVQVADFNLDGKNDLAWKKGFSNDDVHIRINTNSGGPLAATDFATEIILNSELSHYGGVSIADINGDGKPDIIATDAADVGVFENKYSGGVFDANAFASAHQLQGLAVATYPKTPLVVDLNGDKKPELILYHTNTGTDVISIYENKNIHAPVISVNTVSPLKGAVGSTVTVTGNNFSTIPSENKVWFGGVEANVLSSTATEIKAEVPADAGYERVSVVRDRLTSFYHLPFNTTFGPGVSFDNTSFLPPITYPLTGADYDVEVADMNSDGKSEIVAESRIVTGIIRNYGLSYRNVHTTGPITATSFILDDTTATSARNLKLMDVDSDGRPDILAMEGIYRNTSTASEIRYDVNAIVAGNVFNHAWADFNLDGKIDIASTDGAVVSVFENRSARPEAFIGGTFPTVSTAINIAKPAADGGLTAADFDNDGLSEFVSTNPTTDNMSVWRNTGSYRIAASQFAVAGNLSTGDNPARVYAGDLDVDGKMDLLVYHWTGTSTALLIVFHNQSTPGNIVFNRVDFTLPAAATVAHIRDLDGDGKPEIVVTSESTDQFFISKNTSTPGVINASSFAAPFATPVTNPRGLATGDLNADGKPEIIITSAPNSLLIFENAIPVGPTISITSQPTSTAVCNGSNASLTLTATGANNLTYQWQKFDGSVFNNVTNGGGYSGATTATLSINTTGNFGAGDYRCSVSGNNATSVFSQTASLTFTTNTTLAEITATGNILTASAGDSYQWYQNDEAVTDAINQSFEFNTFEYGVFKVDVTDNGCTSTSDEFTYLITDIEQNREELKVYPNPVEENLFVEFKPPYQIQVMGVSGNSIRSFDIESASSSLDFSSLSKGIYFLKIKNEDHIQYFRIIKK